MVMLNISDELFDQVTQAVNEHQPELEVCVSDESIVIEGRFVLFNQSEPFDYYGIRVLVSRDFPEQEPKVFETGGRIPKTAEYHVFPISGRCCLGVWEEWLLTISEPSFSNFLTGTLNDYFLAQSCYKSTGVWPFGERSHGVEGIVESFADVLGVKNCIDIVVDLLKNLSNSTFEKDVLCRKEGGGSYDHCHQDKVTLARKRIDASMAERMLNKIGRSR